MTAARIILCALLLVSAYGDWHFSENNRLTTVETLLCYSDIVVKIICICFIL